MSAGAYRPDMFPPYVNGGKSLVDKFELFDAANPHVYELFKKFAQQALARGYEHFSPATIIERIRWETSVVTESPDGFKINDHWAAFYSRKFMRDFPDHDGFFRTRISVADFAK